MPRLTQTEITDAANRAADLFPEARAKVIAGLLVRVQVSRSDSAEEERFMVAETLRVLRDVAQADGRRLRSLVSEMHAGRVPWE